MAAYVLRHHAPPTQGLPANALRDRATLPAAACTLCHGDAEREAGSGADSAVRRRVYGEVCRLHNSGGYSRLSKGVRRRAEVCGRLRLGRRRGQHGLRLERVDAGDRAEVLRHARRASAARQRLPIPRTARGRGLDAAGRVRSADRRPDRLSVQRLAPAGVGRRDADRPAGDRCATTCRSSRGAWRC